MANLRVKIKTNYRCSERMVSTLSMVVFLSFSTGTGMIGRLSIPEPLFLCGFFYKMNADGSLCSQVALLKIWALRISVLSSLVHLGAILDLCIRAVQNWLGRNDI